MNRPHLTILIVIVLALGTLIIAIRRATEPRYQNRTLTEWLKDGLKPAPPYQSIYEGYRWDDHQHPETEPGLRATAAAVKQIGPDAIPFFLEWAQADEAPKRAIFMDWLNAHTPLHFQVEPAGKRHAMARLGFLLLGNEAKSAWPALVRLTASRNSERRYWAFYCLLACQPDRKTLLPVLARLVHDPDTTIQLFAAHVFHDQYPGEAESAGVYQILPYLKQQPTNAPAMTQLQKNK